MIEKSPPIPAHWLKWWGNHPLPMGAKIVGRVVNPDGEWGTVFQMVTGQLMAGCDGRLYSLPDEVEREVRQALME